jgi:hypothetical protein
VCTKLGPAQCYSHRPDVSFRPCVACPNRGLRWQCCFLTATHCPQVLTAPWFFAPTCAALMLAYNLYELNAEGFPFAFSSSCFHTAPLSTEHHQADWPLRLSPEAAFAVTTSAQARCRSPTSEPAPSATPPACCWWCPSARTRYRGWPIPGELLHPPLLSSIHRSHDTLFPPSPFFLAQEHQKELGATTVPLLCPPRHPSTVRASLPAPFSNPRRWRLHPTSRVVSPRDWNVSRLDHGEPDSVLGWAGLLGHSGSGHCGSQWNSRVLNFLFDLF